MSTEGKLISLSQYKDPLCKNNVQQLICSEGKLALFGRGEYQMINQLEHFNIYQDSLCESWKVAVECLRNHIVDKWKMSGYIFCRPISEVHVEQTLISTYKRSSSQSAMEAVFTQSSLEETTGH